GAGSGTGSGCGAGSGAVTGGGTTAAGSVDVVSTSAPAGTRAKRRGDAAAVRARSNDVRPRRQRPRGHVPARVAGDEKRTALFGGAEGHAVDAKDDAARRATDV